MKKRILYGTGNPAKLEVMRSRLAELNLEIVGLKDMEGTVPDVPEDGNTPLENARQKAYAYYKAFQMPVFSCDSGLYFENVPEELQPGVHVRTVKGKYLTDEEMLVHYCGLAKQYGDLVARYRNAICLVMDEDHVYEGMEESMASKPFLITAVPHSAVMHKGFPLDSISKDIKSGKYFYDMSPQERDLFAVESGFLEFFKNVGFCDAIFHC